MNTAKTISVEPAKMTLADQKTKELTNNFLRMNIAYKEKNTFFGNDLISLMFPLQKTGLSTLNKFYLPLRSIFAALLIISGITLLNSSIFTFANALAIVELILGSFLALGFLTRLSMGISTLLFASIGIIALRTGINDINSFSLMFGSLILCLTGAGKYSLDFYIRRLVIRKIKERKIKICNDKLSYKAFSIASRNF